MAYDHMTCPPIIGQGLYFLIMDCWRCVVRGLWGRRRQGKGGLRRRESNGIWEGQAAGLVTSRVFKLFLPKHGYVVYGFVCACMCECARVFVSVRITDSAYTIGIARRSSMSAYVCQKT